jgi:hypothetical protein
MFGKGQSLAKKCYRFCQEIKVSTKNEIFLPRDESLLKKNRKVLLRINV